MKEKLKKTLAFCVVVPFVPLGWFLGAALAGIAAGVTMIGEFLDDL